MTNRRKRSINYNENSKRIINNNGIMNSSTRTRINNPSDPGPSNLSGSSNLSNPLGPSRSEDPGPSGPSPDQTHKCLKVAIYASKGGTFKTGLISQLAPNLGKRRKNILIIDGDPAMSVTSFFVENSPPHIISDQPIDSSNLMAPVEKRISTPIFDKLPSNPDPSLISTFYFERSNKNEKSCNIYEVLDDYIYRNKDVKNIKLQRVCTQNKNINGKIYLLPGHNNMKKLNKVLGINNVMDYNNKDNWEWASFKHVTDLLAIEYNLDFILTDLGPTFDEINQMIVMSSDALQVPIFGDWNSWQCACLMFKDLLPEWIYWQQHHATYIKKDPPYIFPILVFNYDTSSDGKVDSFNANNIEAVKRDIPIYASRCISLKNRFLCDELVISFLKHIKGIPVSQELGIPVYDLEEKNFEDYYGKRNKIHIEPMKKVFKDKKYARERFDSLAITYIEAREKILELT